MNLITCKQATAMISNADTGIQVVFDRESRHYYDYELVDGVESASKNCLLTRLLEGFPYHPSSLSTETRLPRERLPPSSHLPSPLSHIPPGGTFHVIISHLPSRPRYVPRGSTSHIFPPLHSRTSHPPARLPQETPPTSSSHLPSRPRR